MPILRIRKKLKKRLSAGAWKYRDIKAQRRADKRAERT